MMDFLKILPPLCKNLDDGSIHYALIGGFAMAMRGVQRATLDLDFILSLEDLEQADETLHELGFERYFHSSNVSHYRNDQIVGRIDILHAFRKPALAMLDRAERLEIGEGWTLPVAAIEDIIGLKIQAINNDPARKDQDWPDIRLLIRTAREQGQSLDWELIEDYLSLFGMQDHLRKLRDET